MNDLLRCGVFQVLGLQIEPRVQTRPTSHSGLRSEVGNPDILDSSPGSIALRPCCSWIDERALPFAGKKIKSCSWWPQTYLESRGCCQHFLTVLLCSYLRLGEINLTWRARGLLGLHAWLIPFLHFLPQWSHPTAAQWPPVIARGLGQSIHFLYYPLSTFISKDVKSEEAFLLQNCLHLTTKRPLHNRWENKEGQSR